MSIVFIESFDADTGAAQAFLTDRIWSLNGLPTRSTSTVRTGTGSCQCTANQGPFTTGLFPAGTSEAIAVGAIYYSGGLPTTNGLFIIAQDRSHNSQCYARANTDGTVSIVNQDGSVKGTSASVVITANAWHCFSWQVKIHNTAGTSKLYIDGVLVLDLTGIDTQLSANAEVCEFATLNNSGRTMFYDDIIFADTNGSTNNSALSFANAPKVEAIYPSSPGTYSQWTPLSGANWTNVDETAPNDDTDYVSAASVGAKDSYNFADMVATGGTVLGAQSNYRAKKDDVTARGVQSLLRTNSTDNYSIGDTMTTSYAFYHHIWETDPGRSNAPWTIATINLAEWGMNVSS